MALARQGDQQAFGDLVACHQAGVYRAALAAVGSAAEAEDAADISAEIRKSSPELRDALCWLRAAGSSRPRKFKGRRRRRSPHPSHRVSRST